MIQAALQVDKNLYHRFLSQENRDHYRIEMKVLGNIHRSYVVKNFIIKPQGPYGYIYGESDPRDERC